MINVRTYIPFFSFDSKHRRKIKIQYSLRLVDVFLFQNRTYYQLRQNTDVLAKLRHFCYQFLELFQHLRYDNYDPAQYSIRKSI